MTNLSPAAQAVVQAACIHHGLFNEEIVQRRRNIAAALRAAADQVVPDEITWASPNEQARHWPSAAEIAGQQGMVCVVRRKLLAIAAELESSNG